MKAIGRACRERLRARPGSEAGLSIVELLVALTVFALLITGVAVTAFNGLDLARQNRNRSVAANLASQEMDTLRAQDFTTLPVGQTNVNQTIDGVPYTVTRELSWVSSSATAGPCDAQSGTPQLLRVRVAVSWPDMRGVPPAESNTVLTPPIGAYDPNTGHVAVKVLDGSAEPAAAHPVTVSRTGFSQTIVTTSEGCAYFAFLTADTYTVSLDTSGYVDRQGIQYVSQTVGVAVGTVSSVQFDYDRAATLDLTLSSPNGGEVPGSVALTLGNTAFLPDGSKIYQGTGTPRTITGLFPSTDGYQVWAGDCADADPEGQQAGEGEVYWPDAQRENALSTTPGDTTSGSVALASVDVTVMRSGVPQVGATVKATKGSDHICAWGDDLTIGTTDGAGQLRVALPYGKAWQIEVTGSSPVGGWPAVDVDPTSATVPSVTVEIQ